MARFLADLAGWGEDAVDGPEEGLVHLSRLGGKPGERRGRAGVLSVRRRSGMGQDPGPLSLPAPDKRSPVRAVPQSSGYLGRLQEDDVTRGGELAALRQPAADLQCRASHEGKGDTHGAVLVVLPHRVGP